MLSQCAVLDMNGDVLCHLQQCKCPDQDSCTPLNVSLRCKDENITLWGITLLHVFSVLQKRPKCGSVQVQGVPVGPAGCASMTTNVIASQSRKSSLQLVMSKDRLSEVQTHTDA